MNIRLLHFNPSKMFWADIVDKNWLLTQNIINPNAVYKKTTGMGYYLDLVRNRVRLLPCLLICLAVNFIMKTMAISS